MNISNLPSLRGYRRMSRWLPFHHLDEKLTGLFFCALLVPLLTLIACVLLSGGLSARAAVIPVMLASLAGSALALWGLQELLVPLRIGQEALRAPGRGGQPTALPTDLRDDMGQLLRDLRRTLETSESRGQTAQAMSLDDPLTGLPNQRFAAEYLRLCVNAAERSGARISVAIVEPMQPSQAEAQIDNAGERRLRRLGEFLRQWLNRKSDWLGRWHGDQFVAVMFSDQNHAIDYLDNLRREFSRHMLGLEGSSLTVNVAVAELQRHESAQEFLTRLEEELRSAKCEELENLPPPGAANVYSLAAALRKSRGG